MHFIVARRFSLTPQKQTFPCTQPLITNIADRKPRNERPYQPKNDLLIPINNIFSSNVRQLNLPALDEVKGDVDILKALYS